MAARRVGVVVDLLFASSGIESEITTEAELLEILPGLVLPLARTAHLAALKLLARDDETRPQDAADLLALKRVLTTSDHDDIRRLVRLIVGRGYHRDGDLVALVEEYLGGK